MIHAGLLFDGNMILISDSFKGQHISTDGNVHLSVDLEDTDRLEIVYNRMAEGGSITMAFADTF